MPKTGLNLVITRDEFYKKNYRSAATNFILLLLIISFFLGFIYFKHISIVVARYFPTTPAGKYIDMPPLDVNHLNLANYNFDSNGFMLENPSINIKDLDINDPENALVKYWAKKAIIAVHDYDYVNYRQALQDVRDYFTLNGHEEFLIALNFSRNLEAVTRNFQVVSAKVVDSEIQVASGAFGDRYAWQVIFPIEVIYENIVDEPLVQRVVADLLIVRETTLRTPFFGLAINNINLKATR